MANHPENGDLPAYPSTNVEEYLADLTMQAGATYDDDGDGNHPQNGDLPEYPTTNVEEYLAYLVQAGLGKVTKGYYYNGSFYEDAEHTKAITPKAGSLYYDLSANTLYVYFNGAFSPISSSQVGKFLSAWNCATGLPETTPSSVPYTYTTGDYYMATNIATGAYAHNVAMAGETTSTGIYEGTFTVSLTLSNLVSTAYTTVEALANAIEASVGEGEKLAASGTLHTTDEGDFEIVAVLKWVEQDVTYLALLDESYQKLALVQTAETFTDTISGGLTNYKPNGTTYTGVASTTEETGNVADNDFYFFDGTTWFLLKNTHPEIPAVVQTTGTSTASVMSQNAVTTELDKKVNFTNSNTNAKIGDIWQDGTSYNSQLYVKQRNNNSYQLLKNLYQWNSYGSVAFANGNGSQIFHYDGFNNRCSLALGPTADWGGPKGCVALGAYSSNLLGNGTGIVSVGSSSTDYGYNSSNYRLIKGVYDPQEDHDAATKGYVDGETETYTIATSDWTALASSTPYTYSATVTATHTIGSNTVVELMNDQPVLFATNGFAVGSVSSQSVVIYSIGQPSASATLKINYKG